ncbi:hypothetical protein [Methylobacterium sp. PvR107]|uniref:hypothetical protein n=1 Tax=Methylobacterium sp. PvR107 TaxID=2806597 RepID=UPI001B7C5870|nr:heme/copper-type cytochrome/quinol oxidase subunit 4 [Methylobacterium sp. PvR107]
MPVAVLVCAVAQMGVYLVFLLHITTGPDNTSSVTALAFGVLVVVGGSVWIMNNMKPAMPPSAMPHSATPQPPMTQPMRR